MSRWFSLSIYLVEANSWILSKKEELEIRRQLRILNKPAVKSFKTQYGEIFDCVDIHKQPAFEHPLLKNHTLQLKPSSYHQSLVSTTSTKTRMNFSPKERCPLGTVLIRRTRKEDLIRAKNYATHSLIKPNGRGGPISQNIFTGIMLDGSLNNHMGYYGAGALMDVFEIGRVSIDQVSTAHIILTNNGDNLIDFGWQVSPQITGDNRTHFYTYWSADGYKSTGCFNMLCPGYVQVSKRLTPGMVLPPGKGGIELTVQKDSETGNWLLILGDNQETLGYFPKELLPVMGYSTVIQMGGVVFSYDDEPSPPMGSGAFANTPGACEFKQVVLFDEKIGYITPPLNPKFFIDKPEYYNVSTPINQGGNIGYKFEFGGPGGYKF